MAKARQVVAASIHAFNAHDERLLRALYADDVVFHGPGGTRLVGVDATVEHAMGWLRAFPDARLGIHGEVAEGDWVAQRIVFEGTHEDTLDGPEGPIPATHRRLRIEAMEFCRVRDGRVVEEHLCFDQVELLVQLGVTPELATQA